MRRVQMNGDNDCLRACVAGILERPLESIPNFAVRSGHAWFEDLYNWCLNERIGMVVLHPKDIVCSLFMHLWCVLIFSLSGMEIDAHAVIGRCERVETENHEWKSKATIEHDPAPGGTKLGSLDCMIFLVPGSPASEVEQKTRDPKGDLEAA